MACLRNIPDQGRKLPISQFDRSKDMPQLALGALSLKIWDAGNQAKSLRSGIRGDTGRNKKYLAKSQE